MDSLALDVRWSFWAFVQDCLMEVMLEVISLIAGDIAVESIAVTYPGRVSRTMDLPVCSVGRMWSVGPTTRGYTSQNQRPERV